jgi:Flp pilus assembly protein TadG
MFERREEMNHHTRETKKRKNQRGSVLATTTLGMLALLLAAGLGVDISRLYLAKNELQNAADASALSGASALNAKPGGIHEAADRAVLEMNKFGFNKTDVTFQRTDVRFAKNLGDFDAGLDYNEGGASSPSVAKNIRFVKVTTPQLPVGASFAAMVLGKSRNMSATATAGMSVPLNVFTGYIPLALIDDEDTVFIPGQLYTIRAAPDNSVTPGNYQILAVDGAGASDDRVGLASGVRNVVGPGGTVDTKPGVSAGAVRQGINTRFDDYASGLDPVSYPPDTNIAEGISYDDYCAGTPSEPPSHTDVAVDGRRVVLIPIVKKDQFDNGRDEIVIDRFGAFFLRTKVQGGNGGDIQAEYISESVVVGNGGYSPTGPANGGPPITKPVLYK